MNWPAGRTLLPALGGLVALYLTVPIVAFAIRLGTSHNRGFAAPGLWSATIVSVVAATISLGIMVLFGLPLAYVLARSTGRFASLVGVAILVPLAVPPLIGGILLVYLVGPYTWAGHLFDGRLTESMAGIVIAQTFVAAPFLVTVARASFREIDPGLYDVAETLGLGPIERFFRVAIPAARRGIRAGLVLAWLRAFGEYGAIAILAYHPYSLPVFTYLQFGSTGLPDTEAPTAIAIVIAALVVALGEFRIPRRTSGGLGPVVEQAPVVRPPTFVDFAVDLALGGFRLDVAFRSDTSRIAILGPSGSGKSLTLRFLAGVLAPEAGSVRIVAEGRATTERSTTAVGYVPQSLGLFPHLRVRDQILFGHGTDESRAAFWADRLGITALFDRTPEGLSGGERQRVSLTRTFARDPDLLLLDEPFASLDAPVRAALQLELRALQRSSGVPSVVVTHDPEEAAILADEILVIAGGVLLQAGRTREVFDRPASPAVARILGIDNIFDGVAGEQRTVETAGVSLRTRHDLPPGTPVSWAVRADRVGFGQGGAPGVVIDLIDRGTGTDAIVELGGAVLLRVRCTSEVPECGDEITLLAPPDSVVVWEQTPSLRPS